MTHDSSDTGENTSGSTSTGREDVTPSTSDRPQATETARSRNASPSAEVAILAHPTAYVVMMHDGYESWWPAGVYLDEDAAQRAATIAESSIGRYSDVAAEFSVVAVPLDYQIPTHIDGSGRYVLRDEDGDLWNEHDSPDPDTRIDEFVERTYTHVSGHEYVYMPREEDKA